MNPNQNPGSPSEAQRLLTDAIGEACMPEKALGLLARAIELGADIHAPLFNGQDAMEMLLEVGVDAKSEMAKALVLYGYNPLPSALSQAVEEENYPIASALIHASVEKGFRGPQGESALECLLLGPYMPQVFDLVEDCVELGQAKEAPVKAVTWRELLNGMFSETDFSDVAEFAAPTPLVGGQEIGGGEAPELVASLVRARKPGPR